MNISKLNFAVCWISYCMGFLSVPGMTQGRVQASTIDGFVTRINSSGSYSVGSVIVQNDEQARCSAYNLQTLRKKPYYEINHNIVACSNLKVRIGTYIQAVGKLYDTDNFLASEINDYNFPSQLSTKLKGQYDFQGFELANPILTDWKVSDIFSGGPWNGKMAGGGFLEEEPKIHQGKTGTEVEVWVNGFPLQVTSTTVMRFFPAGAGMALYVGGTVLSGKIEKYFLHKKGSYPVFSPIDKLRTNTYISYIAEQQPDGRFRATKLDIFRNVITSREKKYLRSIHPQMPSAVNDAGSNTIEYNGAGAIHVVVDKNIQDYIEKMGMELLPSYEQAHSYTNPTNIHFRFYVVHPFQVRKNNLFVQVDGRRSLVRYHGFFLPDNTLTLHESLTPVSRIVEMPDGVILIPDTELMRFDNESQLAFALSAAISSVLQKEAFITGSFEKYSDIGSGADLYIEAQRALRIGIRQMYLAGYDIREAPYAWAVAQGRPANNPVINSQHPDKEIPWYAAYAFNYISKYYKDVDYTKLKRGEREYQQFKVELRKADPEAFASTHPTHP